MQRGIISTISVPGASTLEDIYECWEAAYHGKPFVELLPSGTFPDSKHVVGTNRVDISAVLMTELVAFYSQAQRIIFSKVLAAKQYRSPIFGLGS